MPPRHRFARTTGCLLAGFCCHAGAYQLNYSLDLALGYSDNVNQSATDPVGQTMLIPRIDFNFKEEGASLKANAVGQVEYRDYVQGDFSNEVRGQVSGVATWRCGGSVARWSSVQNWVFAYVAYSFASLAIGYTNVHSDTQEHFGILKDSILAVMAGSRRRETRPARAADVSPN